MLLGLAGSLLKTLGKKKSKKNGKQVADSITNQPKTEVDKSQNPTTVFHESGADLKPLEDVRDDIQASSKKKKDPLNLALDGIDNALFGIIDTLTETNILRKKIKSDAAKAQLDKKKSLRERVLEGGKKFVKGAVGSAKKSVGNTWDKIMQFLTWIILGAVVNWIMKNWKSVREQIEKVMSQLKEVFERLKPILVGIKDIVMWLGTTAWDWITKIDKSMDEQNTLKKIKEIEKKLGEIDSGSSKFKDTSKQLENFQKEMKDAKNDKEKIQKIIAKYEPLLKIKEQSNFLNPVTEAGKRGVLNKEGKPERFVDTFDTVEKEDQMKEFKDMYYVDQHGNIRFKEDNKKAVGARFMGVGTGLEFEDIKKSLERREYNKDTNQSNTTLLNKDISNTTLLNKDISSYSLGIEEYSDLSEVFGTTNIFLLDDSNSSSNNTSSSGSLVFSSSSSLGVSIKEAQLLNIDSK